jgi:hypothetical protein
MIAATLRRVMYEAARHNRRVTLLLVPRGARHQTSECNDSRRSALRIDVEQRQWYSARAWCRTSRASCAATRSPAGTRLLRPGPPPDACWRRRSSAPRSSEWRRHRTTTNILPLASFKRREAPPCRPPSSSSGPAFFFPGTCKSCKSRDSAVRLVFFTKWEPSQNPRQFLFQ